MCKQTQQQRSNTMNDDANKHTNILFGFLGGRSLGWHIGV